MMVPVAQVGSLWDRIYRVAATEFPDLRMNPPSEKGGQSKWIIFKADLPAKITIDWKITKATVDLSFWPGAVHRPVQSINLSGLPGAAVKLLGATTAISIPVSRPPADWTELTDDQVRHGLQVAADLLRFYRSNPTWFV